MKHVLITGGSDGLGKEAARKLKATGYQVTILAHDETRTKAAANEIGCNYVVADVSDFQQVEAALKTAAERAEPIDILINNAGIWIQGPLEENDPGRIEEIIKVNVLGAIYCTRALIPEMKKRKKGRIINISSQGGFYAKAERAPYTASKFALTGFTKAMQAELKPYNIAVDGFYPGAMQTEIFTKAGNARDMSKALDPAVVAETIVFICNLPDGVSIPELGILSLAY